nr:RNA-directed DNA polymerase, eukaryota [Tanacetum cinerariifolium]
MRNNRLISYDCAKLLIWNSHVTRDEIRSAIWSCGENISPGPDGYSFEFFKKYWNFVGPDLCEAVEYFFETGLFAEGCNSSFIALIPKVADARLVNDFRPISLIGCIHKVVTKILANRLSLVIVDLVLDTQSAFIANRHILDGPFNLNEILHWCKRKNKQAMFFKVDFAKAYDTVKTLSIGGRLTLLKSVLGTSPLYNMSIFKVPKGILKIIEMIRSNFFNGFDSSNRKITWAAWDKILASKKNGGIGVSSFHALNRALLLKWVWRFISQDGSLWFRVIHALYGADIGSHSVTFSSNWCSIVHEFHFLKGKGFDLLSYCTKRIGDGNGTRFWRQVRNGAELQQLEELSTLMDSVTLSSSFDRWVCNLSGDGGFRVSSVRNFLDNLLLPSYSESTRWSKYVPIKINIFAWRARRDYLPTRANLILRGISLETSMCPLCHSEEEDIIHVLFRCDLAKTIARRLCRWWDID